MKKDPKLNIDIFLPLIKAAENRNGFTLCEEDFCFLEHSLKEFVNQATEKFIDGAKRHFNEDNGCFVSSVPHLVESRKEVVDLWMYLLAEQKQKKNK